MRATPDRRRTNPRPPHAFCVPVVRELPVPRVI